MTVSEDMSIRLSIYHCICGVTVTALALSAASYHCQTYCANNSLQDRRALLNFTAVRQPNTLTYLTFGLVSSLIRDTVQLITLAFHAIAWDYPIRPASKPAFLNVAVLSYEAVNFVKLRQP